MKNNNVSLNNGYGIYLRSSSNNNITGNTVSSNSRDGIYLYHSSNNNITGNTISSNIEYGIYLGYSSNNIIYLNNFIDNSDNVYSRGSANIRNSTSKMKYAYNGSTFTNYMGNYWSDYTGSDADGDGIGDTPYSINSHKDNYPLMMPFESYFAPEESMTQVCVNAPEIVSGAFDVTIDIHNVVDLDSGQFDLSFDPKVVNVIGVHDGDIAGTEVQIDSWEFIDADTIRMLFDLPGLTGASGSGQIATIRFETTGVVKDVSVLDISNGRLADRKSNEISALWFDCEVTLGVPVTVNAPEIISIISGVFNATIEIENVADMNGGQFDLSFDPGIVNVIGVTAGDIDGTTIPIVIWRFIDADTIRVVFRLSGAGGVSGSGYVTKIDFEVTGSGGETCVLDISNGKLADTGAEEIPATWTDDEVVIGVPVIVNAPEIVSGAFNATIEIRNVTDMWGGQFDLSFDPSVVNVIGVDAGKIGGTTIPISGWRLMDAGRIRAIFRLSGPDDVVSGSGYLAKISFHAVGEEGDESVLNLSNGKLVCIHFNEWGMATPEKIPATWVDAEVTIGEPAPPLPTQISVHNIDTGENFTSIQAAIDDPDTLDGHVLEVEDGIYHENVDVTKSLTISSENGSSSCIIQAAKGNDHAVEITSDYVRISGFTVERATAWIKAGIYLNASYCNVSDSNCSNNYYGIRLEGSNNTVSDNDCFLNNEVGISLSDSSNNTLSNNNCSSNNWIGIHLRNSSNNAIFNNNLSNNMDGIHLRNSCSNILSENRYFSNHEGIYLRNSSSNTLSDNNCFSNSDYGIQLSESSDNNVISDNNCYNNGNGVALSGSGNNIISENNCSLNDIGVHLWLLSDNNAISNNACFSNNIGIRICMSGNNSLTCNNCSNNGNGIRLLGINNTIYLNNFINNTVSVHPFYQNNIWNSPQKINYIYSGSSYTNYMGNYWDDYEGHDMDGDGIGDTPYSIDPDKDDYPLMERFENYAISKPIYVPDTYPTIQQVVDNATKRAVITVRDGVYVENAGVNKRSNDSIRKW